MPNPQPIKRAIDRVHDLMHAEFSGTQSASVECVARVLDRVSQELGMVGWRLVFPDREIRSFRTHLFEPSQQPTRFRFELLTQGEVLGVLEWLYVGAGIRPDEHKALQSVAELCAFVLHNAIHYTEIAQHPIFHRHHRIASRKAV